jgi:hypothetical protein
MKKTCALIVCGLFAACEADKVPGPPPSYVSEATAAKAGDGTRRSGATQTAMVDGNAAKGVAALSVGQTTTGALSSADPVLDGGKYFDAWVFTLAQESEVSVTLVSSTFDTYLSLAESAPGSVTEILGSNDDSNGSTNSMLEGTLTAGTYTAIASSYSGGATGEYAITVRATGRGTGGTRVLEPGRQGSGALSASDPTLPDGQSFHEWSFSGRAGDQVTLSVASGAFDTMVGVLMDGAFLAENDDSGGTTNSQLTMYLPWSGTYTAIVTSYGPGSSGAYSVSMSTVPRAPFAGFRTGGNPNGRYALLVGIADYPGDEDDLRGPDDDARNMQALLVERFGFDLANIVTLQNEDATRANIAQGIAQHLGQAGPNGLAVLYYSGHGAQVGDNVGITGALDTEPTGQDQALVVYGPPDISSAILDEELGYLIESLDAGRTLVVLDACFSGSATRGRGLSRFLDLSDAAVAARVRLPRTFITSELRALNITDLSLGFGDLQGIAEVLDRPQRHLLWSASTDAQVSWTSAEYLTGAFTTILDRRLRSEPGTATFAQVHRLVHDDVVAHTSNHPSGEMELQNPQLRGDRQSMTIDEFFRQR